MTQEKTKETDTDLSNIPEEITSRIGIAKGVFTVPDEFDDWDITD